MKKPWEEKSLGGIIKLEYGKPLSKDKRTSDGKYPVYGANGEKDRTDEFYYDRLSIIVGRKGSAGEINLTEKRFWPLDVTYFVTFDDKKYDLGFLYNLLSTLNLPKLAKGVKPGINRNEVYEIRVNIPSFPEQKRVAKILNEVFEKITKAKENTEKNLQNARELFESSFQSTFGKIKGGWKEKKIGDICDLMTGGTPRRNKPEYFIDGKIKWLVSGNIHKKEIFDCEGRITEEGLNNSNAKYLPVNSVIIALNGQGKTRGAVALLRTKATCNQSLVSIFPKSFQEVLPEYIYYNLNGRYGEIRKITGDTGNDRRGLNMPLIRGIRIYIPPVHEQKNIIAKFETINTKITKLETIYQKKLADLEELKSSILQKAFNGELAGAQS